MTKCGIRNAQMCPRFLYLHFLIYLCMFVIGLHLGITSTVLEIRWLLRNGTLEAPHLQLPFVGKEILISLNLQKWSRMSM